MRFPVTETERLILRPLELTDADHIFSTWTSDPRVTKYMTYNTHTSVDTTKEWLEQVVANAKNENAQVYDFGFQLKETGKLIGSGVALYKPEYQRWSLGYNLAYDYWHNGYTSEAMKAAVEVVKKAGIKHFISDHAVENPNSGKVMEKIGMKFDHMGSYTCYDGRIFEAKFYLMDL